MRLGTAALTLVFALGVAGFVAAEESTGSWWSRLPMPWAKSNAKKDQKDEPPPGLSKRERLNRVDAALHRRREVCDRIEAIAVKLGDEELVRKAQDLADRAWEAREATVARIRQQPEPAQEQPDLKNKERRK